MVVRLLEVLISVRLGSVERRRRAFRQTITSISSEERFRN